MPRAKKRATRAAPAKKRQSRAAPARAKAPTRRATPAATKKRSSRAAPATARGARAPGAKRRRRNSARARRTIAAAAILALVVPVIILNQTDAEASVSPSNMAFGMDVGSIQVQSKAGVKPDYATIWVGPWTLESGWSSVDASIEQAVENDVTPVIHFYYWGDDISVSCLERGCWSDLHHVKKDRAGWDRLATGLATSINAHAHGKPVVIILETEFNKGNAQTYEPFDAYLAEKAKFFHTKAAKSKVVLGFGNWNPENWKTFDRAAAASDYVGIQGMRGSTRNNLASYKDVVDATLTAVERLSATFDRPVFLTDLALSSYPEPAYETHQAAVLSQFFSRLDEFHDAGLRAIIYRTWSDNPTMNTQNYFGEAERHWGLTHAKGSDPKPAAKVWINGVKASRALDIEAD